MGGARYLCICMGGKLPQVNCLILALLDGSTGVILTVIHMDQVSNTWLCLVLGKPLPWAPKYVMRSLHVYLRGCLINFAPPCSSTPKSACPDQPLLHSQPIRPVLENQATMPSPQFELATLEIEKVNATLSNDELLLVRTNPSTVAHDRS